MKSANDEISDTVVQQTEVWPSEVELPDNVQKHEIVYASPGGYDLDLTFFTQPDTTALRPGILFVHGGGWKLGDRKQFYRQSGYLTSRYNLFCANIEYRLSHVAAFPGALHDCKTALRWMRSVAGEHKIDSGRIAICGGSAGAHLSALTALTSGVEKYREGPYPGYPDNVSLAILFNGHYDMADQLKRHVQDDSMLRFFGGHPWEKPEVYGEASPIYWVNEKAPPMLLLHGEEDHFPHTQSIEMCERLKYFGVEAEVEIYPGKKHAWFNREPDCTITTRRMEEFLSKHLL